MTRILVIATHPDDEVLGCGGVMARHVAMGDHVSLLVVTRAIAELFPPPLVEQTRRELRQANALLGTSDIHFLDFPAPKLDSVPGHELADAIGRIIRTIQPAQVYLPHGGDIHADHRAVYMATLVAARPIFGCPVRKLLCYETLSETEWSPPVASEVFIPTIFVDISAYLPQKLAAMTCYQSQLQSPPHPRSLPAIEALARFRGATVSLEAAEAFMLVREIVD
ncbi:MAG: PIG-L family deacetylase [Chloroflexi bacterium]|nr:PIG-L family deacetylase [Ardenticatenaceae bacterium]MBL1127672.1 PIG-L family deacetylase [Chloroflexota bacterium]NOG33737.1 PIG-L family deacetylase [Chloroflexota bacterium]